MESAVASIARIMPENLEKSMESAVASTMRIMPEGLEKMMNKITQSSLVLSSNKMKEAIIPIIELQIGLQKLYDNDFKFKRIDEKYIIKLRVWRIYNLYMEELENIVIKKEDNISDIELINSLNYIYSCTEYILRINGSYVSRISNKKRNEILSKILGEDFNFQKTPRNKIVHMELYDPQFLHIQRTQYINMIKDCYNKLKKVQIHLYTEWN